MDAAVFVLMMGLLEGATGNTAPQRTACGLLMASDIRRVQSAAVKEIKPSSEQRRGLHFGQCVYATTDFAHSVSLTVITAKEHGGVGRYWQETFRETEGRREKNTSRDEEGEQEARRLAILGREALWTGDSRAGALYVLAPDAVLRISVGGVAHEEERIRRSRQLASAALRRLHAGAPTNTSVRRDLR
jgi:hypothetical protein